MTRASAVEALLFAALEKPTAAERVAFLDSACAGDAELQQGGRWDARAVIRERRYQPCAVFQDAVVDGPDEGHGDEHGVGD